MKRLILIDSHALIHRAYHALPPLTTKSGELVNAVYGFTSILIKTISNFKPDYIVAAFDAPGATFRHKEYKEYKATRVKAPDDLYAQIPRVKEILTAFKIPIFEQSGYEADDIIGTVAKKISSKDGKNVEVLILTGDLDNLQLISENVSVLYAPPSAAKEQVIYDAKKVVERFEGLKPDQMIDFKGLRGDPSDNIPGVKGVGEKTAITLLNKFGTLEKLYEAIEKNKAESVRDSILEKLKSGKNAAFFSKKLATIKQNVPIKFNLKESEFGKFDKEKLFKLLGALGFVSLVERMSQTAKQGTLLAPPMPNKKIKHLKAPQEISWEKLLKELGAAKGIYIAYQNNNFGELMALAISDNKNIYFVKTGFSNFKSILENEKIKKTCHDFKPLLKALSRLKINLNGADFDTMIAVYILNPGERAYELEKLAIKELGEQIFGDDDENKSVSSVDFLKRLKPDLEGKLVATETEKVFQEIEMPLISILSEMEIRGVKLDVKKLGVISVKIGKDLKILEKKIYQLAGEKFNINSPQQLSDILFFKLKIPGALAGGRVKKTPGGALSTGAAELEKLRPRHKIIDFILKYRELSKLKSTYTDTLPNMVDNSGRIHTTFNQAGTASGRLSSQDPNLQNIPARGAWGDKVRMAFVAEKGYKFISVDYSQIHLRIIAALANDKKMMEAFKKGLDIHKFTAAEVNNVPMEKVTPQMRFAAKALNFGIIYGMGAKSFSESAGINKEKAREFITEYLKDFSGVARYIKKLQDEAREKGYTTTLFGRRRYIPEINSLNPMLRAQAERIAVNMPIQGLEADIIKKSMIEVDSWIKKENLSSEINMILQVHDELLFEVKKDFVKEAAPKIVEIMEGVINLKVPITAEAKIGDNWGEMSPYGGSPEGKKN
ncbi:MAG: DNA polymerase I [bacterium]|nr:DNA polymerase I [bacterium]